MSLRFPCFTLSSTFAIRYLEVSGYYIRHRDLNSYGISLPDHDAADLMGRVFICLSDKITSTATVDVDTHQGLKLQAFVAWIFVQETRMKFRSSSGRGLKERLINCLRQFVLDDGLTKVWDGNTLPGAENIRKTSDSFLIGGQLTTSANVQA